MRSTRRVAAALLLLGGLAAGELQAQRTPEQRARREAVRRGWLGLSFRTVGEDAARRAVVEEVYPDSPADRAGLEEGDTIVRWDGSTDLLAAVDRRAVQPGDTVRLRVRRDGRERDLAVVAAERPVALAWGLRRPGGEVLRFGPDEFPRELRLRMDSLRVHADSLHRHLRSMLRDSLGPRLRVRPLPDGWTPGERLPGLDGPGPLAIELEMGMRGVAGAEFAELNPGLADYFGTERGVLVLRVAPETPAARAGLQAGDVVVQVNDQPVESVRELRRAVGQARGREAELGVVRKGRRQELRMRWER